MSAPVSGSTSPGSASPELDLLQLITSFWTTQAIGAVVANGIADAVTDAPQSVAAIAASCGIEPAAVLRLLRALCARGIFTAHTADSFTHSALSRLLRSDHPRSLAGAARMYTRELYTGWGRFADGVREGRTSWEIAFGQPLFDHLEQHPEALARFQQGMTSLAGAVYRDDLIAAAFDWSRLHRVIDLGGGQGNFLDAVLTAAPHLEGVLFDRPEVIARARARVHPPGFAAMEGDLFEGVPAGFDALILKRVIHDWNDEESVTILQHCARQMQPDGRVLIIEFVLGEPGPGSSFGWWNDLNMQAITGGRERTRGEFSQLAAGAGLSLRAVHPTSTPLAIVELGRS